MISKGMLFFLRCDVTLEHAFKICHKGSMFKSLNMFEGLILVTDIFL